MEDLGQEPIQVPGGPMMTSDGNWVKDSAAAVQPPGRQSKGVGLPSDPSIYRTSRVQEHANLPTGEPQQHQIHHRQQNTHNRPARPIVMEENVDDHQETYRAPMMASEDVKSKVHFKEVQASPASSQSDMVTSQLEEDEPHSVAKVPSQKKRRSISRTDKSFTAFTNDARSVWSTTGPEPEICSYIIRDGVGYHMPRAFNQGLGDRILEKASPWVSQKSLYKQLAFLSRDDMEALQDILTTSGFSDQTFIQVKALQRTPWSKKRSALLITLEDHNPRPLEVTYGENGLISWRPFRAWTPGSFAKHAEASRPTTRSQQTVSNSLPVFGMNTQRITGELGASGAQNTMPDSSTSISNDVVHGEVQDISTRLMDEDDYIRELTTYRVWTIRQLSDQNIKSWAKCILEEESLSQDEILKRVIQLDKDRTPILNKKLALQPDQRSQVNSLIERITTHQPSPKYQWTLRQLEMAKAGMKTLRLMSRTSAIVIYLARSPRPSTNLQELRHRDLQGFNFRDSGQEGYARTPRPLNRPVNVSQRQRMTTDRVSSAPRPPHNPHGPPQAGNHASYWERDFIESKIQRQKSQPPVLDDDSNSMEGDTQRTILEYDISDISPTSASTNIRRHNVGARPRRPYGIEQIEVGQGQRRREDYAQQQHSMVDRRKPTQHTEYRGESSFVPVNRFEFSVDICPETGPFYEGRRGVLHNDHTHANEGPYYDNDPPSPFYSPQRSRYAPRLKFLHPDKLYQEASQERPASSPTGTPMVAYGPEPPPSRGSSWALRRKSTSRADSIHGLDRSPQWGRTPYYPAFFDDEPYDPRADQAKVDESIKALMLDWTPGNITENSEENVTSSENEGQNADGSVDKTEGDGERQRPVFAQEEQDISYFDRRDTASANGSPSNLRMGEVVKEPQADGDKSNHNDTPQSDNRPKVWASAESNEALLSREKPTRASSFPMTKRTLDSAGSEWVRRLVEDTNPPSQNPQSIRPPLRPGNIGIGIRPHSMALSHALDRPSALRQPDLASSPAWSPDGRTDRSLKGARGTDSETQPRLRRSKGSEDFRKTVMFDDRQTLGVDGEELLASNGPRGADI